jgi:hypothetical protein
MFQPSEVSKAGRHVNSASSLWPPSSPYQSTADPVYRAAGSLLDRNESSFGSREADKISIEIVEPPAQLHRGVARGTRRNKNKLDLAGNIGGQLLQSHADIRHVHRTLIGAIAVAEKEECNQPPALFQKSNGAPEVSVRTNLGLGRGGVTPTLFPELQRHRLNSLICATDFCYDYFGGAGTRPRPGYGNCRPSRARIAANVSGVKSTGAMTV